MGERVRDSKTLLTYQTYDDDGVKPSMSAIGTRLRHTGNGKTYTITGFAWNGDTDQWNFIHVGPDGVPIVRPLSHIEGDRADGTRRYETLNSEDRTQAEERHAQFMGGVGNEEWD